MESATILAIVVLGGMGSQLGVVIAAIVMIGGTEALRELDVLKQVFGNDFDPTQYRMLVFGLAMVVIMVVRPRGLISTRHASVHLVERKAIGGEPRQGGTRVSEALLRVEHLTMRFGGLVAVNDLSFTAGRGDITALIGPNGAGKTTVFNCITGFYKPSEGRIALAHGDAAVWDDLDALTCRDARSLSRGDGALFLLERMPDYLVARRARVARTFQNIRLFPGMTVLENLLVAQHNPLMRASGYTRARHVRARPLSAAPSAPRSRRRGTGSRSPASSPAPTIPPARCPMARSAGSRSRAPCAPIRCCSASTSPPPASIRAKAPSSTRSSCTIRADHKVSVLLIEHDMSVVMEHLRPHRRARLRRQDRRRRAGRDPHRPQGHRRLSRRRGRGGRRRSRRRSAL